MDEQINLYSEAYKRGIIIHKDFIEPHEDVFIDNDGVIIDNTKKVYHYNDDTRLVGYYFPDGYKSIKIYFNLNIGLQSSLRYYNGLCFNVGFLNKDRDFNTLYSFCILASDFIFSKYRIKKKENHISDLITMGLETEIKNYNFNDKKMRKFYFTDASLSSEERKKISLVRANQFRGYSNRQKIESAIEFLMEAEHYVGHKDISKITGLDINTISKNLTEEDKERIRCKNIEVTGFPNHNEYIKNLNIDLVVDSYIRLKNKKKKTTAINISNDIQENTEHSLHRVTVSKILKEEDIFNQIKMLTH